MNTLRIDGTELLDALVTSVFLLDQDLHVQYLNAAAQTLIGQGSNQSLGRPIQELTRGADTLLPLFERALKGGEGVVQRELAWPASGGVDRILDCAVTQITIGHGGLRLLLEIEDITQHRRLTRENALLAQLGGQPLDGETAGARGSKIRSVACAALHSCWSASCSILRCASTPAVIISEADRLTNLLDSMLGPGRPPAKQLVNVHELLERVYHLLRSEAPEGVIIDRDYDPSLPALTVDPNHIIQAMLNLGRNAIQALSGESLHAPRLVLRTRAASNVSVGVRRHRVVASIQFEDNGPGVLAEIRDTIFYPLVSGRSDGTGLGLGIAQDLVSRHGGLIEFDSAPGRTIFVISLPMDSV